MRPITKIVLLVLLGIYAHNVIQWRKAHPTAYVLSCIAMGFVYLIIFIFIVGFVVTHA